MIKYPETIIFLNVKFIKTQNYGTHAYFNKSGVPYPHIAIRYNSNMLDNPYEADIYLGYRQRINWGSTPEEAIKCLEKDVRVIIEELQSILGTL